MPEIAFRPQCAAVFAPLWERDVRYKGVHGGRGSGKSHDRAQACIRAMLEGKMVLGCREVQNTISESVKSLVERYIEHHDLGTLFDVKRDKIESVTGGRMIFRGLRDYNAESIKSLEGVDVAWVEEAQTVTERSWQLLTPTIRKPGSEIWCTWNPRYEHDAVDKFFRQQAHGDPDVLCVQANYTDNPYFPDVLRADMERDKARDLALYEHVWMGGYIQIGEGAYYAQELTKARLQGRVTRLPIEADPPIYTAWDLGIDDTTAIWVCQPVGHEVRLIDYYEDRGEPASFYANWVKVRGYDTGTALLPHDAGRREMSSLATYEDHLRKAGLENTRIVPRTQDLMGDIQRTRSFLARCWFDEERCKDGLLALGSYRVEMDDKLRTPKPRPVHDWASHAADAFRQLSTLTAEQLRPGTSRYDRRFDVNTGRARNVEPIRGPDRRRYTQSRPGRGRLGY